MKFHANLSTSFCSSMATKVASHTQRDKHFVKIVKLCSWHPKMCKSIKNHKLKIFIIQILFSYTEERRNDRHSIHFHLCHNWWKNLLFYISVVTDLLMRNILEPFLQVWNRVNKFQISGLSEIIRLSDSLITLLYSSMRAISCLPGRNESRWNFLWKKICGKIWQIDALVKAY